MFIGIQEALYSLTTKSLFIIKYPPAMGIWYSIKTKLEEGNTKYTHLEARDITLTQLKAALQVAAENKTTLVLDGLDLITEPLSMNNPEKINALMKLRKFITSGYKLIIMTQKDVEIDDYLEQGLLCEMDVVKY